MGLLSPSSVIILFCIDMALICTIVLFFPVIRLTPIDGFHTLFDQVGFMLPLGIGIATMAAMYIGLIHLNKKLSAIDRFSIDPVHLEKTKF